MSPDEMRRHRTVVWAKHAAMARPGLSIKRAADALAVGLPPAMLPAPIALPATVIGVITAAVTATGMLLGRRIGAACGPRVEIVGGVVLVAIGARIMAQHML
jgi:manganese efflux pump family protein